MHTNSVVLALIATLAAALPEAESPQKFTITMSTGNGNQPLALIQDGTAGQFVLEASHTGTPAYLTGVGKYKSLFMTLPCGIYGIEAPIVGDNYGYAAAVYGVKGGHQKQWTVYQDEISHELDAALNQLYACKDHANGEPGIFLKFGTPSQPNLDPPTGCLPTVLKKVSS